MTRLTHRRGNALLIVLIAVAVLMILVVGAIRFTGTNREAAASKMRGDQTAACADTARRYLVSRFRTFGIPVANLTLDTKIPDEVLPADQTRMMTAHYDSTTATPTIVAISSETMGASQNQVRDIANNIAGTTLGGTYYRVVVKCREPVTNRETELEFAFRHGI